MPSNGKRKPGDILRQPDNTIPEITKQVNNKSGLEDKKHTTRVKLTLRFIKPLLKFHTTGTN
jgi:hypothetical protein